MDSSVMMVISTLETRSQVMLLGNRPDGKVDLYAHPIRSLRGNDSSEELRQSKY